ncbi:MAG: hypothetical protein AB7F86_09605 [Bdellovibrionales bacterium]
MNIIFALLLAIPGHAQQNTSTGDGRFQLIQLSSMARDQFLLDTRTGKVWQRRCLIPKGNDCDAAGWMQEIVEGITGDRKAIMQLIKEQTEKNE